MTSRIRHLGLWFGLGLGLIVTPPVLAGTLGGNSDLSITKTDGVTVVTPGGTTTYTITVSNTSPFDAFGMLVSDTFPAECTSVTWTCTGSGGGSCTASGTGNISDSVVNLPFGASVTYTATCSISASASGTLVNTATVVYGPDPNNANNTATDSDLILSPLTSTPSSGSTVTMPHQILGSPATTATITFQNPNTTAVTVTCTAPSAPFSVSPLVITVPANGSASTTVSFNSTTVGTFADTLNCISEFQQPFEFSLAGTASAPSVPVPALTDSSRLLLIGLALLMGLAVLGLHTRRG